MDAPTGSNGQDNSQVRTVVSNEVIRKYHTTPLTIYRIKDALAEVTSNNNFVDAILAVLGFVAIAAALPFYPIPALAILVLVIFFAALRHPFLGLILMFTLAFPMVMYQMPALAWVYFIVMSLSLIYGYMHYRTIAFLYIVIALAFSPLGLILSIPLIMLAILMVGHKRASVMAIIAVLAVVCLSGVTAIQNTAYVPYNSTLAHSHLQKSALLNYSVPNRPLPGLMTFGGAAASGYRNMTSGYVLGNISFSFANLFAPLSVKPLEYIMEIIFLLAMIFVVDMIAVTSRSEYKGTMASFGCAVYPLSYIVLSYAFSTPYNIFGVFASFFAGILLLAVLELYRIDVVKALDVRKNDLRMKFGDAFEDLAAEGSRERFGDIGDYEATKKELSDAIIFPIEEKGVSRAYNIKPIKGLLLFGPPGTGKTLLMRAIANEIHAGFYLIKAPNIVSPLPGETERRLASVFAIARKNMPCILFIDEIDSIARSRMKMGADEVHRDMLAQLLAEMDGFTKSDKIIIVGATNVPQNLDPAIMRPGRFDRIIYMPLPDVNGRKEIFKIYLGKLPVAGDVNIPELARVTERYSGADIKSICESVAQEVAQVAIKEHKVLEITQNDLINTIKRMKPSATLAQLREYETFKIDFERRVMGQNRVEKGQKMKMSDVIGLEDAKRAIKDAVDIPLLHPELAKRYGVKPIKGILMFGPPGNGKTRLMAAIGGEMDNVTVLQISGSDLINEDPRNAVIAMRKIFNRASENTPSIVLIDEIDGIAPSRAYASEVAIQLTNELLQQVDGVKEKEGVVIVGATNRPNALDPAILRPGRFDKLIYVRPPNVDERAKMFRLFLAGAPCDRNMNYDDLAKEARGFTGADVNNACREVKTDALHKAYDAGKDVIIEQADLINVIRKMKPSAPDSILVEYMAFLSKYGER